MHTRAHTHLSLSAQMEVITRPGSRTTGSSVMLLQMIVFWSYVTPECVIFWRTWRRDASLSPSGSRSARYRRDELQNGFDEGRSRDFFCRTHDCTFAPKNRLWAEKLHLHFASELRHLTLKLSGLYYKIINLTLTNLLSLGQFISQGVTLNYHLS